MAEAKHRIRRVSTSGYCSNCRQYTRLLTVSPFRLWANKDGSPHVCQSCHDDEAAILNGEADEHDTRGEWFGTAPR